MKALETLRIAWRMARRPRRAMEIVDQGEFWLTECRRAYEETLAALERGDTTAAAASGERCQIARRRMHLETEELFR